MQLPPTTIYLNEEFLDTKEYLKKYPTHTEIINSFDKARKKGVNKGRVGVYISDKHNEKLDKHGWEHIEYSNILESTHKEDSIDFMLVTNLISKLHHFNTPNKVIIEKDTYTHIALWIAKKLKVGGILYTEFDKEGKEPRDYTFMREMTQTLRMAGFLSVVVEKKHEFCLYSGKVFDVFENPTSIFAN